MQALSQFVQANWMLILVMFLSGGMLLWPLVQRRTSGMQDLGTLNVTHLINHENAVLLDVRETREYEGGRLPNALHIPLSQLASRGQELQRFKDRPIIAYCARGTRSRSAGSVLRAQGLTRVYNLAGGFQAWKDAGLPVEKA